MVRAKFRVNRIELTKGLRKEVDDQGKEVYVPTVIKTVVMNPIYGNGDPNHENTKFWEATPTGELKLGVIRGEAAEYFELDEDYYIDFTKAE